MLGWSTFRSYNRLVRKNNSDLNKDSNDNNVNHDDDDNADFQPNPVYLCIQPWLQQDDPRLLGSIQAWTSTPDWSSERMIPVYLKAGILLLCHSSATLAHFSVSPSQTVNITKVPKLTFHNF
ncbi:hypothetical protein PoB_000464400 [Plakobranchus ocellatus]|uniref:Uncharacterized protein n=1 Tax=Plakobranchus ocellatus TaxID=259542 RepID=A0AAV3Y797_9GAST|nr:hypothetical protein PoB_000464400 [Plakobranchus ocellatus]